MGRLLAIVGLFALILEAQFSPGPLSTPHAALDGPARCATCHVFGVGAPQFKCLSCHTEIATRIQNKRGLHAGKTDCVKCHSEHLGRKFELIKWETAPSQFDHRQAGYPLEGKHAAVPCRRCHAADYISRGERAAIKVKDLSRTYLGLTKQCASCHEDPHRGRLGADCASCHPGFEAWKPVTNFDHSRTRYALTGLHQKVACAQCHTGGQYRGIAFSTCADCHKDPHRGAFQTSCQSCHATSGWKLVRMPSTFDHNRTDFPLAGLHAKVECGKCHRAGAFKEPVSHGRCADCHKPDPHKGQFGARDCAACHRETGFKQSQFAAADHQKTAFPLLGKHASVACEKCHVPAGAETVYKLKAGQCRDCHRDAHAGQFADARLGNRCESCHTVEGFRPSQFTFARHQETRFPLDGSHRAAACDDCHQQWTPPGRAEAISTVRYRFDSLSCSSCHADPHQSQLQAVRRECTDCHITRSWSDLAAFDHSQTRFPLQGAHRGVLCAECHRPADPSAARRPPLFHAAPTTCIGCHEDIHGGQFASGTAPLDCASCHTLASWRPSTFDHETSSRFSLAGAHQRVPCALCHKDKEQRNGRLVVIYKGTPTRCAACHSNR